MERNERILRQGRCWGSAKASEGNGAEPFLCEEVGLVGECWELGTSVKKREGPASSEALCG